MPTETTDLVMIMSLRDELSKDLKKATANLDKMKKQLGGNVKETKTADTAWTNAGVKLKDLSRSFLITAVGVTGLTAAFHELATESEKAANAQASAQFSVAMMGNAAQAAYNKMKPQFYDIGYPFMATASQVEKAYGIIIKNSGKATLSVQDLQAAFALSKDTGADFTTTATAIGEALRGNQEDLRALVGPYGYKGVADAEKKAIATAKENYTSLEGVGFGFRSLFNQASGLTYTTSVTSTGETYNPATATPHAYGGVVTEPTAMIGLHSGKRGIMAEAGAEAIVPMRGGGGSGGQIVFNLYATIADKNSLRSFAQQITPLLQQNNRRGGAASATYGG